MQPTRWFVRWSSRLPRLILALVFMIPLSPLSASDAAKEKRWAEQVVDQLFDGEAIWLEAGGISFLGLHTAAASEPKGAVIVLHGIGVHPDWPQVINPLRVGLAESGWDTLAVQMPILPNEAAASDYLPLFPEVLPRVDAALRFLEARNSGAVFIAAHSMGASMAIHYLGSHPSHAIAGLIAIGSSTGGMGSLDESAEGLSGIQIPILDLYGEYDLDSVLTGVSTRARVAAASGNDDFTQTETAGADHFFDGYEQHLIDVVLAWLEARR